MRLLRACDIRPVAEGLQFYYSRTRAVLFMMSLLAGCAALLILGRMRSSRLSYYMAALVFLTLLLVRSYVAARFRPTNWLVRLSRQGLWIKFRSYLNYRLPDTDPTIVLIEFPEVCSARLVREAVRVPDSESGTATQTRSWIEFELAGDSQALAMALELERARPAPQEKRWYGNTSTLYRHYPVRMASPGFLRVEWPVVPQAAVFLESLRPFTAVLPEVAISDDFDNLQHLTRSEQEQRLRELDARGETIAAVYAARRLHGCGLAEATSFIDGLRKNSLASVPPGVDVPERGPS
jgi:hypothetical protein